MSVRRSSWRARVYQMSTYRVELKDQGGKFAVFQSTSESMYCPTFDSELAAEIFALRYSRMHWADTAAFTDEAQMQCASDIRMFLGQFTDGRYPASWAGEDEEEYTGAYADDVIAALESDKGRSRIAVMGDFGEWRLQRLKPRSADSCAEVAEEAQIGGVA